MDKKFKSGFVTIIGRPNVGKSTLMNHLVGEKVSIISPKPQTTRNKITAVHTTDRYQMIFMDTPGIHKPKNKLGEYMMKTVNNTLDEVDVVLVLIDANEPELEEEVLRQIKNIKNPVILVLNKIDLIAKSELLGVIAKFDQLHNFKEIVPISAMSGENIEKLCDVIEGYLDEGPMYFPDDMITDQPERQIVAEIIREKALNLLDKEIPHGIAVGIEHMRKRENKDIIDVSATIYCEKDSHKGIIIGKGGAMLKKIGMQARRDIENLFDNQIFLELWVKVKDHWRENELLMKNFGYDIKRQ